MKRENNTELENSWQDIIIRALKEDIGRGDLTTDATIESTRRSQARIICKQEGILAGLDIAVYTFRRIDGQLRLKTEFKDGERIYPGEVILFIEGRSASILKAERVALNFLGHLSGVATLTGKFVNEIKGTSAKIIDTRKTTPLLRAMEKEAVLMGGGANHRMGLYDMVLIKENHIRAAGSIHKAVRQTKKFLKETGIDARIEVEATNISEVREAVVSDVHRIMLDNMTPSDMSEAVRAINGRCEVEASGGISLETVKGVAATGVDFISIGSLTHSAPAIDFSLLIDES